MHPDLEVDDPAFEWLWERSAALDLTVTLDLGAIGARSYQTHAVGRLARRYPEIRWVIAHLGQPTAQCAEGTPASDAWSDQIMLGALPNVWFDSSSVAVRFPDERYPYRSALSYLRRAVDRIGADKILWGTDAPGMLSLLTYKQLLDLVATECDWLDVSDQALILGENAQAAYRISPTHTLAVDPGRQHER